MVMPRPSLSTLPMPSASTGRSSMALPVGKGSVRSSSGKSFAGVLADQGPSDHSVADTPSPSEGGRDQAPEKKGTDDSAKAARQQSAASPGAGGVQEKVTDPSSSGMNQTEGEDPKDSKVEADSHTGQQEQTVPQSHDETATASLNMQALSLAALMAQPQPVTASLSGASQSGQTDGTGPVMASSSTGQAEAMSHNSQSSVAGLVMALASDGSSGVPTQLQATASATAISSSSTMSHLSQPLSSSGTVGSMATASTPAMMQLIAGTASPVSSHEPQQSVTHGDVSFTPVTGEKQVEMRLMAQQVAQSSPSTMSAAQSMKDRTSPAVQVMSFQSGITGILPTSAFKMGEASAASRQDESRNGSEGQPDNLFSLMVKASSKEADVSFAGSGEQGSSGSEQGMAGHGSVVSADASVGDDGQEMSGNLSSFAGLVTSSEGRLIQPAAHDSTAGVVTHETRQAGTATGLSALQGSSAAGVLTGRVIAGQAGTLTMTVMTADSTSVHVQLDRSAEGLSALSLQGQDDGTTEALQKTHHDLVRQLDEAGLPSGLMKIDVLPADAGHMAGGQDQNMPQHQGHGGYQASGQHTGQPSFQQGGGFPAGGGQQEQRSQQGRDLSSALQQEPSFRTEEDAIVAPAAAPSTRLGHLNISV